MAVVHLDGDGLGDPRLADYAALNQVETRREVERRGGFFIAESEHTIRELVATRDRWPIRSALLTPAKYEALRHELDPLVSLVDLPVFVAPVPLLRAVAGFNVHRGALASATRTPLPSVADVVAGSAAGSGRLVAVLEGVADHENIGSIFRSAAAFGVAGVLIDEATADPLYRRSLRVSLGHVLHVPFTRSAAWAKELRDVGFTIAALTPSADAVGIDSFVDSLPPGARVALVLGAEGPGLSDSSLAAADVCVRVPIAPGVDSLNVAVAAAIAFHRLAALRSGPSA